MNIQPFDKQQDQNARPGKPVWKDNSHARQNLEIKRRFQELHIRKEHLENELRAVKNCLLTLDRQMKEDPLFKQLLIGN